MAVVILRSMGEHPLTKEEMKTINPGKRQEIRRILNQVLCHRQESPSNESSGPGGLISAKRSSDL